MEAIFHPLNGTVREFLDRLASPEPTPGGGSVAALTGALAAGLVSMVCYLTIGRQKYAEVEEEMRQVLLRSEALRRRLQELVQEDMEAYGELAAAYKLPRESEEAKAVRRQAIQRALVRATEVPLEVATVAREVLALAQTVAEKGNRLAVSDAGIAGVLGEAAVRAAGFNVWINLASSEDSAYRSRMEKRLQQVLEEAQTLSQSVVALARERIS